jgi:hypothetical protein
LTLRERRHDYPQAPRELQLAHYRVLQVAMSDAPSS